MLQILHGLKVKAIQVISIPILFSDVHRTSDSIVVLVGVFFFFLTKNIIYYN